MILKTQQAIWNALCNGQTILNIFTHDTYFFSSDGVLMVNNNFTISESLCAFTSPGDYAEHVEPKWYDNIGNGILCWVSDEDIENEVDLIFSAENGKFTGKTTSWLYAEPISESDINKFTHKKLVQIKHY